MTKRHRSAVTGEYVTAEQAKADPERTVSERVADLWLVGQFREVGRAGNVWDYQGVFSSRAKAVAACRTADYFIAPVMLDQEIPDEAQEWPGVEHPVAALQAGK